MSEKEEMISIWITWDTYGKLLQLKGILKKNPDETVKETNKILEAKSDVYRLSLTVYN